MEQAEGIHATKSIGDGKGRISVDEITTTDISISVSEPTKPPNGQGNRLKGVGWTVWLDDDVIKSHVEIQKAPEREPYDAVVSIAGAPIPDGFDVNNPLEINISIRQDRQAKAAECLSCGSDLRETFEEVGCINCGFCPTNPHGRD